MGNDAGRRFYAGPIGMADRLAGSERSFYKSALRPLQTFRRYAHNAKSGHLNEIPLQAVFGWPNQRCGGTVSA